MPKICWNFVLLLVLFSFSGLSQSIDLNEVEIHRIKRGMSGKFYYLSDSQSAKLKTIEIQVDSGKTLSVLLSENRVYPEMNAIRLTGLLNPSIKDLNRLIVGSSINLPSVEDSASWAVDFYYLLNISKPLSKNLVANIEKVETTLLQIDTSGTYTQVSFQLDSLKVKLNSSHLQGSSVTYLTILDSEIQNFDVQLCSGEISYPNMKISTYETLERIELYDAALKLKEQRVQVKVYVKSGDKNVNGCRIVAKMNYLFGDENCSGFPCLVTFGRLDSPASAELNGAEYKVFGLKGSKGVTDTVVVHPYHINEVHLNYLE